MGLKDIMRKLATNQDEGGYDDYDSYYENGEGDESVDDVMGVPSKEPTEEEEKTEYTPISRPVSNMNISGNAIELKVVKPESFKNATQIADHLLSGRTVVLNLEKTNKETARRLIDFLFGAAYAIGGDLKKVSNNTYVITPSDTVAVSGDSAKPESKTDGDGESSGEYFEL